MKRLTYRDEEGTPHWREELLNDDTGWAGELIRSTVADLEDAIGDCSIDRLQELAKADKAGKIMILPVKTGEYIYLISLNSEIVPCRVGNIAAEEWGTSFEGYVEGFGAYRTGPNEKVFFSRESAEAALAKEDRQ